MKRLLLLFGLGTLLIATGCAQKPAVRCPVAGTVMVDGAALEMGKICFVNPDKKTTVFEVKNGSFQGRATSGTNRVEIYALSEDKSGIKDAVEVDNSIPEMFNTQSTLTAEINPEGPNDLKFEIQSKNGERPSSPRESASPTPAPTPPPTALPAAVPVPREPVPPVSPPAPPAASPQAPRTTSTALPIDYAADYPEVHALVLLCRGLAALVLIGAVIGTVGLIVKATGTKSRATLAKSGSLQTADVANPATMGDVTKALWSSFVTAGVRILALLATAEILLLAARMEQNGRHLLR